MTNAEKLEALVQYGADRGVKYLPMFNWLIKEDRRTIITHFMDHGLYMAILTYKPLARALFGKEPVWYFSEIVPIGPNDPIKFLDSFGLDNWQYHLQQAVISDDPIGYYYNAVFVGDR